MIETVGIVCSAVFTSSSSDSKGTILLRLHNHSKRFHVSMLAIIFILRSAALVLMSSGLLIETWSRKEKKIMHGRTMIAHHFSVRAVLLKS